MDVKKAISLLSLKRDVARKLQESWKDVEYCPPDGAVASAELFYCQHKEYADALDLAIAVLKLTPEVKEFNFRNVTKLTPMPEAREPLRLEQLKQMDGKPVWIEDTNCWGLVFIPEAGRFKNAPFVLCRKRGVQIEWQVEGSELTIYPYPPAHIDRSKWEECKYCKTCWTCKSMVSPSRAINTKCFSCENLSNHEPLNFCPHCGRPLTEEAWAELERRLMG